MLWMMVWVSNLPSLPAFFFSISPHSSWSFPHCTKQKQLWLAAQSFVVFLGCDGRSSCQLLGEDKIILVLRVLKMPNTQNFCIALLQNTKSLHPCIASPECLQNCDKTLISGSLQALQQGISVSSKQEWAPALPCVHTPHAGRCQGQVP